jgi:hypothetical protein
MKNMTEYFKKVMCSDEQPKNSGSYMTNHGWTEFSLEKKMWTKFEVPEWWMKPVSTEHNIAFGLFEAVENSKLFKPKKATAKENERSFRQTRASIAKEILNEPISLGRREKNGEPETHHECLRCGCAAEWMRYTVRRDPPVLRRAREE